MDLDSLDESSAQAMTQALPSGAACHAVGSIPALTTELRTLRALRDSIGALATEADGLAYELECACMRPAGVHENQKCPRLRAETHARKLWALIEPQE